MQQLPDLEKFDSNGEFFSGQKSTTYNSKSKICANFKTDTDKVNIVV